MALVTYTANAGQTTFDITFDFISDSHLTVEVNGMAISGSDWTLNSPTSLELDPSYVLAEGDTVAIRRQTPSSLLVSFQAPASLRPRELSLSYKQLLFLLQELQLQSGQGLPLTLTGTAWDAQNLPLKSLAAPVDDADAVTKIFLENALTATGVLPEYDTDDIGLGLRVRGGGAGVSLQLSPINGQILTFQVPVNTDPLAPPGTQLGYVVHPGGISPTLPFTIDDMRIPLVFVEQTGTPEAGAVSLDGDFDLVIPRGKWRIRAYGSTRNLNTGAPSVNKNAACFALTGSTGSVVYTRSPIVALGPSGGDDHPINSSCGILMETTKTFLATTRVNLRGSAATSAADVVLDTPFYVIVEEVPF